MNKFIVFCRINERQDDFAFANEISVKVNRNFDADREGICRKRAGKKSLTSPF